MTSALAEPPVAVTADSVDPVYNDAVIDVDEERSEPVPHRYVHGHFKGTEGRFSFYFPPKEKYEGRFFHNTYPLADTSDIAPFPIAFDVATGDLAFTLDSGAYYVQTNNGSVFSRSADDPAAAAYKVNAAAAKFSRIVAARIYGDHRPFGYLYGGSGGAYQTIGGAEHTEGVWDGFMPYVLGCNAATPCNWTPRMQALRVLRRRNKFPDVMDAIDPGGSGDIYAGLDEEERSALLEATRMGFPPRGWYAHETQGSGYFADIQGAIPGLDPTYMDDFWTKPGYLGSDPAASIHAERFNFATTVKRVIDGPIVQFELATLPGQPVADAHVVLTEGPHAGRSFVIAHADGSTVTPANLSDADILASIKPGDPVRIDNSWPLAMQTLHRHQMPPDPAEYGWNQFRDAAGKPLYPQRERLIGHVFAISAIGTLLTGRIRGKTLLVQALMDIDAFPWYADWYRTLVKSEIGSRFDSDFALWFIDHAQHDNPHTAIARAHAVPLGPALQYGLRELARWVEQGIKPADTAYRVNDGQVEIPETAAERGGVQPVVDLKANGGASAEVAVGEAVSFEGVIEVPSRAGKVVAADWDFEGTGDYPVASDIGEPAGRVALTASHAFARPGTYFAILRGTSQRESNVATPHCRIENIARVRVIVR
jgi:hypothetical protein